jgi:hypothetical protein
MRNGFSTIKFKKMETRVSKSSYIGSMIAGIIFQLSFIYSVIAQNIGGTNPTNQKDSIIFNFKPQEQTWIVPEGVSQIHVDAYGAQGGSANGGKGGRVQSDLKVTPGSKLIIYVGSQPSSADGGYNGGGKGCGKGFGGGGATDIRIGGTGLDARVLVAGGGGGFGYGGSAGAGGGLVGGEGKYDTLRYHVAKGGTQEAGGAGARAYFSQPGKAGVGGDGINQRGSCTNNAMGGGGGGYFGGGGSGGGGAGGGSSFTNEGNINVVHQQGVNKGNGKIKIYWEKIKK